MTVSWRDEYRETCFRFIRHVQSLGGEEEDRMLSEIRSFARTVLTAYPGLSESARERWELLSKWPGKLLDLHRFLQDGVVQERTEV